MKHTKIIVSAVALGILLGGGAVLATKNASAFFGGKNSDKMAQDLASKLNVSKDQVSSALDQMQNEKQQKIKDEEGANLDKAVKDGVITADQKQKILDKQAELQKQRQDQEASLSQWAKDSGIDFTKLKTYHIGLLGFGRGPGAKK